MATLSSCFARSCQFKSLSLNANSPSSSSPVTLYNSIAFKSRSFSSSLSSNVFSAGITSLSPVQNRPRFSVVCDAAPKKKVDSADKRARQNEKRRVRNKARKSEVRTRIKKVLVALDGLKKKREVQAEEIVPIEKLIGEAFSVIDKAVKVGILHRNTGANRKSRLSRRKKAVEIHHGWYVPSASASASA